MSVGGEMRALGARERLKLVAKLVGKLEVVGAGWLVGWGWWGCQSRELEGEREREHIPGELKPFV